jgi:predicted MPP superfamily phosphohydrolase
MVQPLRQNAAYAEPVDRRGPRLRRFEVPVPGLDPAHDGVRIAHLSDVHVGMLTPERRIVRAIELANEAQVDLTVLTGDYLCYSPKHVTRMQELFADLRGTVIGTLGNHDHWTDAPGVVKAFNKNQHALLCNTHTTVTVRHTPLHVIGVDDALTGHADAARAFRGVPKHGSRLTLTHIPDVVDQLEGRGAGLVLAGHTHGGHVNIPRVTARIAHRLGLRYLAGFYPVGDALLYVNTGVGSSSVPIRAGAPAEVVILTLRCA